MIILALTALVLAIAVAGGLALVVACVRAEDGHDGLSYQPATRAAGLVRRLTGLRVCPPEATCTRRRPASLTPTGPNRKESS